MTGIELLESLRDDLLQTSASLHKFINSGGPEIIKSREELVEVVAKIYLNLEIVTAHFRFEKEVQKQLKAISLNPKHHKEENYEDMDF